MKTKSALPWFGSDASVAKQLGAMLDDCKHVTIPFAGGMSILPHLKAKAVVANDLHEEAVHFYRVVSGVFGDQAKSDLIRRCNHTLSHPSEMARAADILEYGGSFAGRGWAFWAQCWIGRKGKGGTNKPGGKPSVRRKADGGNNATRIKSAAADLEAWADLFGICEFTCEDFRECLRSVAEDSSCGIYCDPPWFGAGKNYKHTFTYENHLDLMRFLTWFENTRIVVRYGDCQEVRDLYCGGDWHIHEATSRTQANKSLGELWITNFEVAS